MPSPHVVISARGEQRLRARHPWIYRSDVIDVVATAGDIVKVVAPRGRHVGYALFSDRSQIPLRLLTFGDTPADPGLISRRIVNAVSFRKSLRIDGDALRLVHGEADLLPSLVIDRYGDFLVVQTLSQGMDRLLPTVVEALVETIRPKGILMRNDPKVRALEGLEQTVGVVHGSVPELVTVREGHVTYEVDLWKGQKTGLFLDQRENREAAARYASGRLLDAFSYNGGFALHLSRQCSEVEAVDISADAVARIRLNGALNGLTNLTVREANVFDDLRRLERGGIRYDTVVLDPPAFAKNKASVPNALAGYKEINLRAMRLLSPGGYLVTCSCSYNVSEAMFGEVIHQASIDSHTAMTLVEKRSQGRDHPVLVGVPETHYLKCFVLRRVE
jgi:23S rRNA (cytosine1962-C5)-methyltransferase